MTEPRDLSRAKKLAAYWGIPWHQVEVTARTTGVSHYAAIDLIAAIIPQPRPKQGDTHPEPTQTTKWDTSAFQAKQGPRRCRNCNQPTKGFCRKCRPQHNIKTR